MPYRSLRDTFRQEDLDRYGHLFWPVPPRLTASPANRNGRSLLAELVDEAGNGVSALLPQLGIIAQHQDRRWALSIEEMARLGGVTPKTAIQARNALAARGLVTYSVERRRGVRLHHWEVSPSLRSETKADGRLGKEYHFFTARLLYGGNWAQCTPVQRDVLLALATVAFTETTAADQHWVVRDLIHPDAPRPDINRCSDELTLRMARGKRPALRFATASLAELAARTGRSVSAVCKAVAAWKHPSIWPGARNNPDALHHAPIGIYPSRDGSLVYHFRDHAPPWDWATLNSRARRRKSVDHAFAEAFGFTANGFDDA